jgi:hypothetical protein
LNDEFDIPHFLKPVAIWDARERNWRRSEHFRERTRWAQSHIPECMSTYRIEFYLIDAPCALVYRYQRDDEGHIIHDEATSSPVKLDPVFLALESLPPARTMRDL